MTAHPPLRHADLVAMLAEMTDRPVADVPERVGSMELAWLVHQVEQRYGQHLDLTDDQLARIRTVDDAREVLGAALAATADG
ncbi:acyl carrier protein [Micromonospora echinofusca]|uniref:Acyl carrier protein n=1 Tax=Micromonospora echinofusca TaxID=47858 RepID=A0ABS3W1W9_MICEH|nr:acyl carrier protein [Micromonospora echinofusca]MBO4210780.1 acyl carrier protein [Micromonospora echinofusca]